MTARQREQLLNVGLREIQLTPWSAGAVDHWKRDAELGEATDEDGLRVRKATGHWSWFLHELGRQAVDQNHQWRTSVEQFQQALLIDGAALTRFDLRLVALPLIEIMAKYGDPVTIDELRELADASPSNADIATVLRWGDLLQLVTLGDEGRWSLDPFLRSLMLARQDHAN